jgi:hypothetical protein
MAFLDAIRDALDSSSDRRNPWPDFTRIDMERRTGKKGPTAARDDRYAEGRAISSMLPPGIGPAAAMGAAGAYEMGLKPLLANVPALNRLAPEALQHVPGVSSEPSFLEGLKRILATGAGGIDQNLRDLGIR